MMSLDSSAPANPGQGAPDEYEEAFGESARKTLDLNTWKSGEDLPALYAALEKEVRDAVEEEESRRDIIRRELYPRLPKMPFAAPDAGLHGPVSAAMIERVHRGLLFNGAVEAADGTMVVHDTLPITITQIGVYLVSYNGASGSYAHRLFRKDLRARSGDPVREVIELLERRRNRGSTDNDDPTDAFSTLFTRGVMAWAERAFLFEKSTARWRMGHGNPTPYELLSGRWAHDLDMMRAAHNLMRRVVEHKRFVFVTSAPRDRLALTLGHALGPMEYLVLDTNEDFFERMLETGGYRRDKRTEVEYFAREIGPQVVRGLYRVSTEAPPYLFYAHRDYVHEAALIAMADGALQLHRGFPMLIDLADRLCSATFGADDFLSSVRLAYSQTGQPYRYLGERETRA